jgi:MFS family permease
VVVILALILGLDTADVSAIGSISTSLEQALHISNAQLGPLASLPALMTGLVTIPIGLATDRTRRVRLPVIGIIVWGVAEAASGASGSILGLLLIRLALGGATAPVGPTPASLVGDYFPARDRGYIWG